ncbi:amino acid adenylation domain-containing protein [Fulvivirgaceae bacterium BMA10]|uniref:Amino acid adenylation domain-containing protein n=1 Tax=Splendidivirga corallicola TaxID=3051826 RepID=A0ABT8KPE0_9BACT|nr:amino acid adenylation domain-containing protein [Fulvivirgaceae bacterium BMA10]
MSTKQQDLKNLRPPLSLPTRTQDRFNERATEVREGHIFSREAFNNLSPSDQNLFEKFGQGPITSLPYYCIHHAFEERAMIDPDAVAAEHLGASITYGELNREANKLAVLLKKNGVSRGDNVALFLERSIPMLVGIMATLKVGAAYVPQHVGVAPEKQLNHIIKAASTTVILTLSHLRHMVPVPEGHICIEIDKIIEESVDSPVIFESDPNVSREDRCFILFTSGTTGLPNGVQVTHGNVCNILLSEPGNLGMRPGLKVSQILSIAFDMAAWEILGCLAHGATLVIRGKDISEAAEQADVIIATPSILNKVNADKCKNVKSVAVAGEPCPVSLANKWASICTFYNSCGPTETTIVNTMQPCEPNARHITIGKPTPNNTVYILDENKKPCAIGEVGQMWAGGDCVSMGYLDNDHLNEERYALDPFLNNGSKMFRTGDLGRWTETGELEHHGRVDDQVKFKGFRVELDSISAVLETTPTCKRAVTLKLDDSNLVSFVRPLSVDINVAKEKVASSLPYYCVPSYVIGMDSFPITSRGKIDKRLLIEIAREKQKQEENDVQLEDPTIPDLDKVALPDQQSFSKRIWKHPSLMPYHRLFSLVVLVNLALLFFGIGNGNWWTSDGIALGEISNIVLANFFVAIIIRQQHVINLLFRLATSVPINWPLAIRRRLGKVYHFGGIHSGGTTSGTIWFAIFVASITYHYVNDLPGVSYSLMVVTYSLLALLFFIVVMALPKIRARYHNNFEMAHRFGGWTALILFWTQMVLFITAQHPEANLSDVLFSSISFWMLVVLTMSILLPWLRLRRVPVEIIRPSSHVALVRFNHGETPFAGSSTAISRNPLMEWHSFANVPEPGRDGFRLTISRAGDWTGAFIDDKPSHVWIKGITTAGVGNVDQLFKRVIWVATGSGIGPCLPHLLSKEVPSLLVWATRNPRKTYGDALVDEILEAQPNAIIWDTDAYGKPDMVKLAYKAYEEFNAEAVICISNKKLTWKVVYGMESRNIPAYGAIWDS